MLNTWYGGTRAQNTYQSFNFVNYDKFYGAGKSLYQGRYLGNAKAFQCPSINPSGAYASFSEVGKYNKYYDMDHLDDNGSRWLCCSYLFKAYETEQILDSAHANMTDRPSYKLRYPSRPLAADIFYSPTDCPPFPRHLGGLNVLYEDASCQFVKRSDYAPYKYYTVRNYFKSLRR
jgi:hypothetical protein